MESKNNIKNLTTEQVASLLGYDRVTSFCQFWQTVCPDCLPPLPDRVPQLTQLKTVLAALSLPKQGRKAHISRNAADLLFQIQQDEKPVLDVVVDMKPIEAAELQKVTDAYTAQTTDAESRIIYNVGNTTDGAQKELSQEKKQSSFSLLLQSITALDAVYAFVIGIGIYSAVFFLAEIGIALGAIYALISYHAMWMAKNRKSQSTAAAGIFAVVVLETLGSFAHFSMFNLRIFQAAKSGVLPFDAWQNPELPSVVAVVISAFVALTGIYCVWVTHAQTRETINAEAFEQAHGVIY